MRDNKKGSGLGTRFVFCRSPGWFHIRYCDNFHTLCCHRSRILGIHEKAFYRTGIDTRIADNATEPVDLPGLCLLTEHDSLRGAFPLARPAGDTSALIYSYMTAGERVLFRWLDWIKDCGWPAQ